MALAKFSQDDTQPFGTGIFVNDQGRSIYTSDPEGARSIAPTPAPPSADDAEPPTPPGTRVSYAGDTSSPYANAVASNEGATGSATLGAPPGATGAAHSVVAKAAQVVPPMGPPPPPASAPTAASQSPAEIAVSKAAAVIPPIVKSTTTVAQGRKASDVNKQIGTDRAALEGFTGAAEENALGTDARAVAGVDKRIESRQTQQAQAQAAADQAVADKKAADERVKQLMDLPDGQLDPDRFVNSLSTGSKIGLTVLAAISGFANGMRTSGSGNGQPDLSVLNVLTRRIDEDIAAQKDQLGQGRLRKSNLIARAEAQGATAKQAEAAARGQLWSLAADIGDLQAQRIGLDGAQLASAKQQTAAMRYQAGVHEGDLRAQEENKIQTSREVETGKPTGGGANPELQNKAWEAYTKAIDAGQKPDVAYQQSGLAALGITQPTGAPKRTEGEAKASAVRTASAPYATKLGLVEDPEHPGQFVAPKGKEDDSPADTIMGGRIKGAVSGDRRKLTREVKESRLQLAHAIMQASGGGMKLDDAEELVNGSTLGEIAESLNSLNSQYGEHRNEAERNTPAPGVASLGGRPVP